MGMEHSGTGPLPTRRRSSAALAEGPTVAGTTGEVVKRSRQSTGHGESADSGPQAAGRNKNCSPTTTDKSTRGDYPIDNPMPTVGITTIGGLATITTRERKSSAS